VFKRTWNDWGELTTLRGAPPCFESPLFRADVQERLEKAIGAPIRAALARWRAGPVDRSNLFAGITVGNEVAVPDYRIIKLQRGRNPNSPPPRDRRTGVELTDAEAVRGGYCSLYNRGYTAEKIDGMARERFGAEGVSDKNRAAVVTELLDQVVHDYLVFRAKILHDGLAGSGSAQLRIYTHTIGIVRKNMERHMSLAAENTPTVAASINPYSRPGFTVVRSVTDFPDVMSQLRAAAGTEGDSLVPWGAVESYATWAQPGRPQTKEEYSTYLDMLFGSGAKLVSVLEVPQPQGPTDPFSIAAESGGVKSAIKEWVGTEGAH